LLEFPGPLLDEADACALLGITGAAFRREDLSAMLDITKYDGVFSTMKPRWWRGRLQRWLSELADGRTGLEGADRSRMIAQHLGHSSARIRAASCVWCGQGNVATACSICRQAVDPTHGLRAALDSRPAWSEFAYVCFQCIQKGRDAEARFQPAAFPIVDSIRSGRLRPEI
jgi:hypothetical protein